MYSPPSFADRDSKFTIIYRHPSISNHQTLIGGGKIEAGELFSSNLPQFGVRIMTCLTKVSVVSKTFESLNNEPENPDKSALFSVIRKFISVAAKLSIQRGGENLPTVYRSSHIAIKYLKHSIDRCR
jgi:hypothetical protein